MMETVLNPQCMAQSVGPVNHLATLLIQAVLAAHCSISSDDMWPKDYGPTALEKGLEPYDFIIIGGGTSGSVVASRLSENPKYKVLLIEAGDNPPKESEIPSIFFSLQHTKYDWEYYMEPDGKSCLGMRNEMCFLPRGKVLGGSGSINGMLYIRGNRRDYDNWRNLGNPDWGWDSVREDFDRFENYQPSSEDLNRETSINNEKLLKLSHFDTNDQLNNVILNAAREIGLNVVKDFDAGQFIGYGNVLGTLADGERWSTAKSYLQPAAANRSNLHVIKNAIVTKINFDDKKLARSVNLIYKKNHEIEVIAKKEIILSAGAIDTPKLLMLSGVGPKQQLTNLGIPVVQDLSVGDNLQDHFYVPIAFKLNENTATPSTRMDLIDAIYNYLLHRKGFLTHHGTLEVVGFINTKDIHEKGNTTYPDIQLHHYTFKRASSSLLFYTQKICANDAISKSLIEAGANSDILFAYVVLLNPISRGYVKLKSTSYHDKPVIFANYLSSSDDMDTLLRGIDFQLKIMETLTFQSLNATLVKVNISECDQFVFKTRDYWTCYIRHMGTTLYHPVGTTKMGPDNDPQAVLDSRLRLRGVKNLRVADASIMPNIVSANTNAATIVIAEKLARFIKDDTNDHEHYLHEDL